MKNAAPKASDIFSCLDSYIIAVSSAGIDRGPALMKMGKVTATGTSARFTGM